LPSQRSVDCIIATNDALRERLRKTERGCLLQDDTRSLFQLRRSTAVVISLSAPMHGCVTAVANLLCRHHSRPSPAIGFQKTK
jgi:hypothetical protein